MSVATTARTGRAILKAMIAGADEPEVLAGLAMSTRASAGRTIQCRCSASFAASIPSLGARLISPQMSFARRSIP